MSKVRLRGSFKKNFSKRQEETPDATRKDVGTDF